MRNKYKRRPAYVEHSYWQSFSDMMAALLLLFVLIIAITLAIYKQRTQVLALTESELTLAQQELDAALADLEIYRQEIALSNQELSDSLLQLQIAYENAALTEEELAAAYLEIEEAKEELRITKGELQNIVGIRTDIIGALQSTFQNSSMKVDPQTGSITFSSDVLFRYNSATLTNDSKEILKEIIPMYLDVLLQDTYGEYIAEIIIEGHTDTDGSYKSNQDLSFRRANAVAQFCLQEQNGLDMESIEKLQQVLTVNARSYSSPVYAESGEVDMAASRRVEIKFRLKEDEMIEKISAILGQEDSE